MTIYAYSDGGCRGRNSRNCQTWGSFRVGDDPIVECDFGIGSNQTAEVNALIACLEYIKEHRTQDIVVCIDSQWTYNMMFGIWRIKDERLKLLIETAKYLLRSIYMETEIKLEWHPREDIVAVLGH